MDKRLDGKVAVVTGAASGIGEATARLLLNEGAAVALLDVDDELGAAVADQLHGLGRAVFFHADVTSDADVARAIGNVVRAFGRIDVLVNNAGIGLWGTVETMDPEAWDRVFAVNVRGPFLVSKHALAELRQTRGSIVNIGSGAGLVGVANSSAYCASKGAVISLTRAMAIDYAGAGIRVNCVCPGVVDTPFNQQVLDQQADPAGVLEAQERAHPMGRLAQPGEIAQAILFLASSQSSFSTGSVLMADGGLTAQ